MSSSSTKALFLDRDGVINIDHGYVHKIEDFDFIDGIFDMARLAIAKGYVIFIVTNQAGIGRGYYSEKQFKVLSNWMSHRFKMNGVIINKIFFSPYHPLHGIGVYKRDHISRKPRPGMINDAKLEYNLALEKCILIGNSETDIKAGLAAGVGTNILFGNSFDTDNLKTCNYHQITHLSDAVQYF